MSALLALEPLERNGSTNASLFHWHLRKCSGTMLRKELSKSSGFDYAEYHGHAKALHGDRFYLRQASGAHVRSFVVLRDPYEQAVSEYDDFWEEYEKRPNDQLLADDHMLCSSGALLGVCDGRPCDDEAIVRAFRLLDQFSMVGFTCRIDRVLSVLAHWVRCVDPARELALRRSARRPPKAFFNLTQRVAQASLRIQGARNPLERKYWERHLQTLGRFPSRAWVEDHNRCARRFYEAARVRYSGRTDFIADVSNELASTEPSCQLVA